MLGLREGDIIIDYNKQLKMTHGMPSMVVHFLQSQDVEIVGRIINIQCHPDLRNKPPKALKQIITQIESIQHRQYMQLTLLNLFIYYSVCYCA